MDSNRHIRTEQQQQLDGAPFAPGVVIDGKYKILSVLGTGGMGIVYRVRQLLLNKDLALKMVDSSRVTDTVLIRRFQVEAKAAFSLNHPCLVKVHDLGVLNENQPYLVMDLVEGVTLAQFIAQQGPLPLDQIAPIFAQACFGLSYAHQHSVVHRDIKPSNIMLVSNMPLRTEGSVKILDFGIAKIAGYEGGEIQALTRTGEVFGSPLYMSPEQCSGALVDHRSDIYSLGCVLFEALTGTPPHVGPNALRTMMLHQSQDTPTLKEGALGRDFPQSLELIVAKMLAKSPAERYDDLGVVAHELSVACSGQGEKINRKQEKRPSQKSAAVINLTALQLASIILGTFVAASAITLLILHFVMPRPATPTLSSSTASRSIAKPTVDSLEPLRVATDLDASINAEQAKKIALTKKAFDQIQEIKFTVAPVGGIKQKVFTFPSQPIGHLTPLADDPKVAWNHTQPKVAKDEVRIPDVPVTLGIDEDKEYAVLANASVFRKIDKNAFTSLCLGGLRDGDQIAGFKNAAMIESTGLHCILLNASNWSHLIKIIIKYMRVSDKDLDAINRCPVLENLALDNCKFNEITLASQPMLRRVRQISLTRASAEPIVRNLAGSNKLEILQLTECSFSPTTLCALRTCPHLRELYLARAALDDQLLNAITQLKSVELLSIGKAKLKPGQIERLLKCRSLQSIHLLKNNIPTWKAMHITDARVQFDTPSHGPIGDYFSP